MRDSGVTECRHYWVSGRVQRVYYRVSTQAKATELGLTGWVRNLEDGRVEAVACGAPAALEALETWLWQGPERAEVSQVEVATAEPEALPDFQIR